MVNLIHECIKNFGEAPRKFSLWDRMFYLKINKPQWIIDDPSDDLSTYFKHANDVLCNGNIIWGHLVQANELLYKKSSLSCPGAVVYSLSHPLEIDPEYLEEVADKLFALKGMHPSDPDLAVIADHLTNEMSRVFGLPVPKTISPDSDCYISTTYFVRKHIPCRKLISSLIPIVINRNDPLVAVMLPGRYWSRELIDWWSQ